MGQPKIEERHPFRYVSDSMERDARIAFLESELEGTGK